MKGEAHTMSTRARRRAGLRHTATAGSAGEASASAGASGAASSTERAGSRQATHSHTGTHTRPTSDDTSRAPRQPKCAARLTASGGASIAPMELPVKSTPMPRGRSSRGSARCTVCDAPGNDGDSAKPRATRSATSAPKPGTTLCSALTSVHTSTAPRRPRRAPTRSIIRPDSGAPRRYASEKADATRP